MMDPDGAGIGTRFVRCCCAKCFEHEWSACKCRAWTGGQPAWEAPKKSKKKWQQKK